MPSMEISGSEFICNICKESFKVFYQGGLQKTEMSEEIHAHLNNNRRNASDPTMLYFDDFVCQSCMEHELGDEVMQALSWAQEQADNFWTLYAAGEVIDSRFWDEIGEELLESINQADMEQFSSLNRPLFRKVCTDYTDPYLAASGYLNGLDLDKALDNWVCTHHDYMGVALAWKGTRAGLKQGMEAIYQDLKDRFIAHKHDLNTADHFTDDGSSVRLPAHDRAEFSMWKIIDAQQHLDVELALSNQNCVHNQIIGTVSECFTGRLSALLRG